MKPAKGPTVIPGVYHSVDSVIKFLTSGKYAELPEVQKLLSIYEDTKAKRIISSNKKKKPFIVLEGLDGCGKSRMTRELSNKVHGEIWSTPPNCLLGLRKNFDSQPQDLRRAYYAIGNYIAASEVSCLTETKPVIMDRFWHSTMAYAIASSSGSTTLPKPGDPIYCWPGDLLKPDIVLFLEVSEDTRQQRLGGRREFTEEEDELKKDKTFRERITAVYKLVTNPEVTVINCNPEPEKVLKDIMAIVGHLFYH